MNLCEVIKPGLFTTVQDLGRYGYQSYGVPVSGAMDNYAFIVANLLVGNKPNDACLEATLLGPELEFLNEAQLAITGAVLTPTINKIKAKCWMTFQVRKGDVLSFGNFKSGLRAYLAVRGGIEAPVVLGSRSTYARGGFGGFQGRPLRAGDVIKAYKPETFLRSGLSMPHHLIPIYGIKSTIEVVLGPQSDYFTETGLGTFFSSMYSVTSESDRMGYRLDGPMVEQKRSFDMVSDAVPVGAVQVPANGKPIVVMQDGQTTGGYPKVGIVITPDVSRLGQVRPNHKIKFSEISASEARVKLLKHIQGISQIKDKLEESKL
ncbi:MAG: biotin-dependent carboxyltransferase family protein [Candidatus Bathyarchaeota archaeon]|nr:MAG: biotin-dependent carboxyltransferase family protein [Candidatus Bathyarchaeota archaeon]